MIYEKKKKTNFKINTKNDKNIIDSKQLKYSNKNYRMSYGDLQKVNNNKCIDQITTNPKNSRSYNTGLLINNIQNESMLYFLF